MNARIFAAGRYGQALVVTRVADGKWHVLEDDLVVGRGRAGRWPDGRMFVSIDVWRAAAFDRLADAMLTDLPAPLHTLVGAADPELSRWQRAGFTIRRRQSEYLVPTDPQMIGLEVLPALPGVRIVPVGQVDEGMLRGLNRAIRQEVEAGLGWQTMPAQVGPRPEHMTIVDPTRHRSCVAVPGARDAAPLRDRRGLGRGRRVQQGGLGALRGRQKPPDGQQPGVGA